MIRDLSFVSKLLLTKEWDFNKLANEQSLNKTKHPLELFYLVSFCTHTLSNAHI